MVAPGSGRDPCRIGGPRTASQSVAPAAAVMIVLIWGSEFVLDGAFPVIALSSRFMSDRFKEAAIFLAFLILGFIAAAILGIFSDSLLALRPPSWLFSILLRPVESACSVEFMSI